MPALAKRFRGSLLLAVAAVLVLAGGISRSRGAKPKRCPPGRFVVAPDDAPLLAGDETLRTDYVVLENRRRLSIASGCGETKARMKARRRHTRVVARWRRCGDLRRVRMSGRIRYPECDRMTARLRAKGLKRVDFTASRSVCGDGIVDTGGGEACEPGFDGCPGGAACSAVCTCPGTTATTVTPTTSTSSTTPTTFPAGTTTTAPAATTTAPPTTATTIPPTTSTTTTSTTTTTTTSTTPTTIPTTPPPDPGTVAPPIDPTVATDFAAAIAFLYEGMPPIQFNVAPGAIEARRAAVLRGRVLDAGGLPLDRVVVSVLDHPEFGQTLTRTADGMFDLAVSGGGVLTVRYERDGFLPAERQVDAPWRDYAVLPDVVLIEMDAKVTPIDLGTGAMQAAQGSPMTDGDGTRTATVLFPPGTTAEMVLPDGSMQPLTGLGVRATEYTVGGRGPEAMPAQLPPTSGYTYAFELSVDEALAAGATEVRFGQPLPFYVENFLGFPAGTAVPTGSYDRGAGEWTPSEDGLVIDIVSETGGRADLDLDGDGAADDASLLGVTDAEREALATLYDPPQSLWRVPIPHFSPWDCNWPFGPPPDAEPPPGGPPDPDRPDDDDCDKSGSIIEAANQTVGERIPIPGTPFTLNYRSDRVPGRTASSTLDVPLTGDSVPASLDRIDLVFNVGGQHMRESFAPGPNLAHTVTWDGRDGYGRAVLGGQPFSMSLCHVYPAVFQTPATFERSFARVSGSGATIVPARTESEIRLCREREGRFASALGSYDARAQGLGGWTLDAHHAYDPDGQVLYLGDGTRRSTQLAAQQVIVPFAGNGVAGSDDGVPALQGRLNSPRAVAPAPDGSVFIAEAGRVSRVDPLGILHTIIGGISQPLDVAVGRSGDVYVADLFGARVLRVAPDGTVTTVAGNGTRCEAALLPCGDGGLATAAEVDAWRIALSPTGSLFISEVLTHRVREVTPDGVINPFAGTGSPGFSGDGGAAALAELDSPTGLATGADGTVYVVDSANNRVRAVFQDGTIETVAGNGSFVDSGDGGPAKDAGLRVPERLAVTADNALLITTSRRLRRVGPDGVIRTLAGTNVPSSTGDGGPAAAASLRSAISVGVDRAGDIYVGEAGAERVRRIIGGLPGFASDEIILASADGREIYGFDPNGRHRRTVHALTGATLLTFGYDPSGRLTSITDGDANETTIERDPGTGAPTAIVGPFGHRTTLAVNADGWLEELVSPAAETHAFTYHDAGGLLATYTDPRGNPAALTYDGRGRLERDDARTGGPITLAHDATDDEVTLTDALGRTTTYRTDELGDGSRQQTTTFPDGTQATGVLEATGNTTVAPPDGSMVETLLGPDPRWGIQAPLVAEEEVLTPGGRRRTVRQRSTAVLTDPLDPLSLETLTQTETRNGRDFVAVVDAAQRTLTETTPEGRETVTTFDAQGRAELIEAPGLAPIAFAHDARGRLETITVGTNSRQYGIGYDAAGNVERITPPLGGDIVSTHDDAGRVLTQTRPGEGADRTVALGYDPNGNMTSITPPGQPAHTFTYTAANQLASHTAPDVGLGNTTTTWDYNTAGQLDLMTRPDGSTVDYAYDQFGRLDTITIASGTVAFDYDAATGQPVTVTAPDGGTVSYGYDGPLVETTTWAGTVAGSVSRVFDSDLRVRSVTVAGDAAVDYLFDDDGLVTEAGDLVRTYDAVSGLPTGATLDTLATTATFNEFGELATRTATAGATTLYALALARDDLGRVMEKQETIGGTTVTTGYTYDAAGRLATVTRNSVQSAAYTYDANGNRLSGPASEAGTYDAQDRILTYGTASFTHTASGARETRTVGADVTAYDYDALGNLNGVGLPDGRDVTYVVDGTNRRIGKMVDGVLEQGFLYQDHLRVAAELDGTGQVVSRFVYADMGPTPAYMVRGGDTFLVVADHLGSPRLVVNAADGTVMQEIEYDEWGKVTTDTNPGFQPFGFAGGLYDSDTGLVRFGARDYDPEVGRFTTQDPRGFAALDTNLYAYAFDDPVNLTDPSGEFLVSLLIIGAVLGAALAGVVLAKPLFDKYLERQRRRLAELERLQREEERRRRQRAPPSDMLCKNPPPPVPRPEPPPVQPTQPAPPELPNQFEFEMTVPETPVGEPAPRTPDLAWTNSPPPCPSPLIGPPIRGLLCV